MASSLGMGCGKGFPFMEEPEIRLGRRTQSFLHHHLIRHTNNQTVIRRACLVSNLENCRAINTMSSSSSICYVDPIFEKSRREKKTKQEDNAKKKKEVIISEVSISSSDDDNNDDEEEKQLDEWMRYSVSEIVRNIGEAPLLMHVYSKNGGGGVTIPRIERENAMAAENWPHIRRRWEEDGSPIPDGVILVEQLHDQHHHHHNNNEKEVAAKGNCNSNQPPQSKTETWGVLVQGRGADYTAACYILKTCRVWSSLGFCTHFCLVRAKCFGEIAELQLNNSWLHTMANE